MRLPRVPRATATPTRPQSPLGSPCAVSCCQLSPPSVDRNSPLPDPPIGAYVLHGGRCASHIAANSTFGASAAIAKSAAPTLDPRSSTLSQVAPPSLDR